MPGEVGVRLVDGPDGVRAVLSATGARDRGDAPPPAGRCPQALWEVHAVVIVAGFRAAGRVRRARGRRAPDARRHGGRARGRAPPGLAAQPAPPDAAAARAGDPRRRSARCGAASAADRNFRAIRWVGGGRATFAPARAARRPAARRSPPPPRSGARRLRRRRPGAGLRRVDRQGPLRQRRRHDGRRRRAATARPRRAGSASTGVQAMEQTRLRRAGAARATATRSRRRSGSSGSSAAARARAAGGRGPAEHVAAAASCAPSPCKLRGRWRDVGTILMREGLALWWPTVARVVRRTRRYSVLLQRAIAAQRGLFDPDALRRRPERGLAAQAVGSTGTPTATTPPTRRASGSRSATSTRSTRSRSAAGTCATPACAATSFPPQAVIPPGGTITRRRRHATATTRPCSPGACARPVFENASYDEDAMGDGAYLFDPLGNVRATMVYPCRDQCSDPLQGAVALSADPNGRRESVTITNVSAGPDRPRRPRAQEPAAELPLRPRLGPARRAARCASRSSATPADDTRARQALGLREADPARRRRRREAEQLHRHHARLHRVGRPELLSAPPVR